MAREFFKNLPAQETPMNAKRWNGLLNGEEAMGSIVVDDIECKNLFNAFLFENQTKNGLTLSIATDGKITITGTATANTNFYIPYKFDSSMLNNQYTYSVIGTLTNLGNIGFKLSLGGDVDNSLLITPNFQKRTFTMTQNFIDNVGRFDIYIKNGQTVDTSFYTLLEKGLVATEYTPYKKFGYNSQESMGKIVVDDISSNNKFDINSLEKGHIVSTTGEISQSEAQSVSSLIISDNSVTFTTTDIWKGISSGFMEVKPLTPYYFLHATTSTSEIHFYVSCYDKNKNHLGRATKNDNEFITLENTKYVRWCTQLVAVGTITLTNLQFKEENLSNYIPHIDFTGRTNTVTGQECPTNEYVDGERVYVKRINFGSLPNATSKNVAHGLTNYTIIRLNGVAQYGATILPIPNVNASDISFNISVSIVNTNIMITTGTDRSSYNAYIYIYYTKN